MGVGGTLPRIRVGTAPRAQNRRATDFPQPKTLIRHRKTAKLNRYEIFGLKQIFQVVSPHPPPTFHHPPRHHATRHCIGLTGFDARSPHPKLHQRSRPKPYPNPSSSCRLRKTKSCAAVPMASLCRAPCKPSKTIPFAAVERSPWPALHGRNHTKYTKNNRRLHPTPSGAITRLHPVLRIQQALLQRLSHRPQSVFGETAGSTDGAKPSKARTRSHTPTQTSPCRLPMA